MITAALQATGIYHHSILTSRVLRAGSRADAIKDVEIRADD
jgi:hypothetical protein